MNEATAWRRAGAEQLVVRLKQIFEQPPSDAVPAMAKLFDETLALAAAHVPEVDVRFARRWYRQHRPVNPSS